MDAATCLSETLALTSMSLERGVDYAAPVVDDMIHNQNQNDDNCKETTLANEATLAQIEGVTVQLPSVCTLLSVHTALSVSESNGGEVEQRVVDESVKMLSPGQLSSPCENAASQTTVAS
ncbi:hypothetical protein DVH05_015409 [Phytophthora capsici]|nr:hypothetical protein DVH05_015409 [Phytophthora capsici]